jgi:hypothetical protein
MGENSPNLVTVFPEKPVPCFISLAFLHVKNADETGIFAISKRKKD